VTTDRAKTAALLLLDHVFSATLVSPRVPFYATAFAKRSISSAGILPVILCRDGAGDSSARSS